MLQHPPGPSIRARICLPVAAGAGLLLAAWVSWAEGESGQIGTESIEIDGDMFATELAADALEALAPLDWVDDASEPNSGSDCVQDDGIVLCNEPGVSARPGGTGTWHGARVLDGFGGHDDVFLGGSMFDDTNTWAVGLGNVGSSKNDASEVFLANSDDRLYFAMQRFGNNGTTAFDFEFNQAPPTSAYVPTRTPGDLLLVFELDGSGKSGSVEVFGYRWLSGDWSAIPLPADTLRAINQANVAGPPWGNRDDKGNWGSRDLARFTFAEVSVPIGAGGLEVPVDGSDCSMSAWVSIRTRPSNEFTSAMKDAFEIIEYEFSGLSVAAMKTGESAADLTMTVTGVVEGNASLQWQARDPDTSAWVDLAGETSSTLVVAHDDAQWEAALDHSVVVGDAFVVEDPVSGAELAFVGRLLRSQVRLVASQTIQTTTCTLESSPVTLQQIVAVDP